MPRNYYLILGVPRSATEEAIRSAYLRLARELHPDVVGPQGTTRFQEISEAYEVLSDPSRRRLHDRSLDVEVGVPPPDPGTVVIRPRPEPEPLVPEPVRMFGEPETIRPSFEEVVERWRRNFTGRGVPKAERLEGFNVGVILSRAEAARGGTVPFVIPVFHDCASCGSVDRWVLPCRVCGGTGMVQGEETVRLRIPPGVGDGAVMDYSLSRLGISNFFLQLHISVQ